ncbi:MAG: HAD family hydrolase [Peptococcaceae bacterium]|nr:HAD family hydrolase [Peptococcaceae bacterium]
MSRLARPGIIWDFDDTLVNTAIFFETAREKYARFMVRLGFPLDGVLETLNLLDIENVRRCGGFLKECFPRAMVQTYVHFCGVNGVAPDPDICGKVEEMGWWVFEQRPRPVPGAAEVLAELREAGRYEMFLATKGDPSVQWRRIEESGLRNFFKKVYVLKDKTSVEYIQIARRHGLDPRRSWVVGNSIKSDINPGLAAGFSCIFIPNPHTWDFEMEDPVGDFVTMESLRGVPGLVLGKTGSGPDEIHEAAR